MIYIHIDLFVSKIMMSVKVLIGTMTCLNPLKKGAVSAMRHVINIVQSI